MSFQKYDDVVAYVDDNLPNLFSEQFKYSDMNKCPSQTQLIVNQTLEFAKGAKIKGCTFDMKAKIGQSSDKFCIDVNEKLKFMSPEDRTIFFNKICDKLKLDISRKLPGKTTFLNEFITELKNKLNNISPSAQFNCVQNTIAVNDQKVIISGKMECDSNSAIKLSSSIFAKMAVKCMSKPAIDTIKMDKTLMKLFRQGDNENCSYDLELVKGCDGNEQQYKAIIVTPQRGTGTCPVTNNQIVTRPCSFDKCEVGNWKEWSLCYDDNGEQKQFRSREIVKQGIDCDKYHFREERLCNDENSVVAKVARSSGNKGEEKSSNTIYYVMILILLFLSIGGIFYIWKKEIN